MWGSPAITSRAAPRIWPFASALKSASLSTTEPYTRGDAPNGVSFLKRGGQEGGFALTRAQLTRTLVFFILLKNSSPTKFIVAGPPEQSTTTRSLSLANVSISTFSTGSRSLSDRAASAEERSRPELE